MSLNVATVWEVRTTGSQDNGGGFYDRVPGTSVDYSQQDAAQLSVADLATDVTGTGLSSATGGFTAAMVGNIIHISGGTLTAGWYEIIAHTDTNSVTIDRSAGSSKSGGSGKVGGAFLLGGALDADFMAAVASGNTVWVASGSYTLGESVTGTSGSAAARIVFAGYNAARNDNPIGVNRPIIDCAAYTFTTGDYWAIANIVFTGTAASVVILGTYGHAINSKATNTSATANRYAWRSSPDAATFAKCEGVSTLGSAFSTSANGSVLWCYAHDSDSGIDLAAGCKAIGCVADTCITYGVRQTGNNSGILNSTIYNCGSGVSLSTYVGAIVVGNIVKGCTVGLVCASTRIDGNYVDYNCLDNTTNRSYVPAGAHDVEADPLLNDPANGDFSLAVGSPCFDAGAQLDSTVGLP